MKDEAQYKTFYDWGNYCGDPTGNDYRWYTPNAGEWICVLNFGFNDDAVALGYQDDIRSKKAGPGRIIVKIVEEDTTFVEGLVIVPDYFEKPSGINFTGKGSDEWSGWSKFKLNQYTLAEWAQMETAGAAFLPCAGFRRVYNSTTEEFEYERVDSRMFCYWAPNPYWREYPENMIKLVSSPTVTGDILYYGGSVRLMREIDF